MVDIIESHDDRNEEGDPYSRVNPISIHPQLHHEGSSCQLIWGDDSIFEPVSRG
jgi:hypothetical protein